MTNIPPTSVPTSRKTVHAIQNMIRAGRFAPGERLPAQRILAEELNVSRASLREALSTLEALGFVKTEAGRGTFVADNSVGSSESFSDWRFAERFDLGEVYGFRYAMEATAVRLAAMYITDQEIAELKQLHESYKAALQSLDLLASTEYDFQFHRLIMSCTRNRVYVELYEKFRQVFRESQMLPFSRHNRRWEAALEHGKILEALERRDGDGASYYMNMHMLRASECLGIKINAVL